MEELREFVVTRTYTIDDLIQLLGEGKKDVKIKTSIGNDRWSWTSQMDAQILQVEIREPVEKK
jgi:hypothetical protein